MTDSPAITAFDPVPTTPRHDGWTPARQLDFIAALGSIGLVAASARAVGMSPKSAYALRRRTDAQSFAAAWDAALIEGQARARSTAIERALYGVATPIFYGGRQIGERRSFDNALLIAALRASDRRNPSSSDHASPRFPA